MLFINISSDKVHIADAQQEQFLDRNTLESTLGKTLVEWYRQSPWEDILLLNGPGGFTNLRVGTLTLNLLNKLLDASSLSSFVKEEVRRTGGFKIYSITKFDLYAHLFAVWFLSHHGLVYIGQRDNIRLYDAQEKTYEQIKRDAIPKQANLFFDFTKEEYRGENVSNMLSFHMTNQWLEIHYKDKSTLVNIADLWLQAQLQVKPEYMIEAIVN